MKFNQALNNFTSGEWSPKMKGRTDVQQYVNACEKMDNFLPQVQGGAFRRPPTKKVPLDAAFLTDLAAAATYKQISRYLSNGTNEILVSMDTQPSTTWFAVNGPTSAGRVINSVDAAANFLKQPTSAVQVGDLVIMVHADTGAGKTPRVWSGASGADRLSNFNDFVHTGAAVGHGNFYSIPYLPPVANVGSTGINAPTITVGASAVLGAGCSLVASSAFFDAGHVGSYLKVSTGGVTGVIRILTVTNSTNASGVNCSTIPALATYGSAATTSYEESAWSDYRGWPRTVTAYQGRLIFGGTKTYPDTIWGSRIGNIFDFMERPFEDDTDFTGYTDDNSRPFTLAPNTAAVGYIQTLSAAKTLLIHTDKGEIVAFGTNGALGPNDVTFESSTSFGASSVPAVRTNNYALFVDRTGRKLRDVNFNFDEGQYVSSDLTFLSDHLTVDKIPKDQRTGLISPAERIDVIEEVVSLNQNSTYVICKTDKWKLLGLALDREYKVNAWFQINIGGRHAVISDQRDFAPVYSIGSLNTQYGDELYMITGRKVNGSVIVRMERMLLPNEWSEVSEADFATYPEVLSSFQADYQSTGAITAGDTTLTVGTDFALEEVELFVDGKYRGKFTPDASGIITLGFTQAANGTWACGFPYTSTLKPMPMAIGQQIPGSPQGLFSRIDEISVRFWNTFGAKYGYKETEMTSINFRDPNSIDADPVEFFTGMKVVKMASNYQSDAGVIIIQDKPWPCNVLAVVCKGQTYD